MTRHAGSGATRRQMLAGAGGAATLAALGGWRAQDRAGAWRRAADLPIRVQEIYPAGLDGKIYVLGGLSPDQPPANQNISDQFFIYDIASDSWTEGPRFPELRHHPHLVAHGGAIYAIGGFSPDHGGRWSMRRTVHLYRPGGDGWEQLDDAPAPIGEAVALSVGDDIHIVTGRRPAGATNANWTDHADTNAHLVYAPASGKWTTNFPAPTARNSATGVVLEGKLHVIGGRSVGGGNYAVHEVFDPDAAQPPAWTSRAPLPQAQGGLAAAVYDGKICVFGGEYFTPGGGGGVYPETWVYDAAADAWSEAAPMPTPRHGLGAVAGPDGVYVIAGAAEAGGAATTAALEVFRP